MVSERTKGTLERIGIALSFFGLFAILQPFSIHLYKYGFQILCIGGIIYIVLGYIPPRTPIKKSISITLGVFIVLFGAVLLGIYLTPYLV